jgi:hypothetical protein
MYRWLFKVLPVVVAVSLAAFLMATGLLISRIKNGRDQRVTICRKVDRLDSALILFVRKPLVPDKPGQPGYRYYHDIAPDEAKTLRTGKQSQVLLRLLRSAACDPSNLPH